jgi:uncharacterized protein (TIGR01777 family)
MTFLVTGATGFIGRKIVAALLARGDAVYYLARQHSAKLPSQASFHPWDTGRVPDLNALSRIDAILHLAGEPVAQRWSTSVKKRIYDSRIDGTHHLVTAIRALQHRPHVLVSASAIGYYGDRGDEILTENAQPGSDFLSLCKEWEQAAFEAEQFGVRVVTPRLGMVLGREGGALPAMLAVFRLGIGGRLGSGRQWMSWIHVEDVVRLFLFAADSASLASTVNATSPEPVTNQEFTKTLASVLHRPALFSVPKLALQLAMGEVAEAAFHSQRVIPTKAQEAGFVFNYPNLRGALETLV